MSLSASSTFHTSREGIHGGFRRMRCAEFQWLSSRTRSQFSMCGKVHQILCGLLRLTLEISFCLLRQEYTIKGLGIVSEHWLCLSLTDLSKWFPISIQTLTYQHTIWILKNPKSARGDLSAHHLFISHSQKRAIPSFGTAERTQVMLSWRLTVPSPHQLDGLCFFLSLRSLRAMEGNVCFDCFL